MRVFVTGGTGFVGRHLTRGLVASGHDVTVLTRSASRTVTTVNSLTFVEGDSTRPGAWQEELKRHDVVINLAGAPIFKRWTSAYRRVILDSRILTTTNVVDALKDAGAQGKSLLSASAVGYYGFHDDDLLDENSNPGTGFLAEVARRWENAASGAAESGVRVLLCRFGIVLGSDGGALAEMVKRFKQYPVTVIGDGRQWFSWIHVQDLVRALQYLMEDTGAAGPVNCVSPNGVRNRELTEGIAESLAKKVSKIPVPGFMLRLGLGEFADTLLRGQRVYPRNLLEMGFKFEFPELGAALADLLRAST